MVFASSYPPGQSNAGQNPNSDYEGRRSVRMGEYDAAPNGLFGGPLGARIGSRQDECRPKANSTFLCSTCSRNGSDVSFDERDGQV